MENDGIQPGQTVTPTPPAGSDTPAPAAPPASPPAEPPAQVPAPEPAAPAPAPPAPETPAPAPVPEAVPEAPQEPEAAEQQPSEDEETAQRFDPVPTEEPAGPDAQQSITWTASEFIAHAKSFGWYAALAVTALIGTVFIFLITRDPVSVGVIVVATLIFGIYAGHKPRELQYQLDASGLSIGQKHFEYQQFRSFSVIPEGAFSSIVFMPLKRFAVPTTIYYAPEDEDKIVDILSDRLPVEQGGHDAVDRLMHRIHF